MTQLQGRQQMQQPENAGTSQTNQVSEIVDDFFGYDPSGTTSSLIPGYSEYQPVIRTPSPEPTQHQDDGSVIPPRNVPAPRKYGQSTPAPRPPRRGPIRRA